MTSVTLSPLQAVSRVVDLDKLMGQLTQRARISTPRTARQALQTVIDLKQLLEIVRSRDRNACSVVVHRCQVVTATACL